MIKYSQEIPESFYKKVAARAYDILQYEPDLSDEELRLKYRFSSKYEQWKRDVLIKTNQNMKSSLWVKIAVTITIILIISLLFSMNVGSIRDIFYDWLLTYKNDHVVSIVDFQQNEEIISQFYKPSYLPSGYSILSEERNKLCYRITYINDDYTIDYQQLTLNTTTQIDIEKHSYIEYDDDDLHALYYWDEDNIYFVWQQYGYQFQVNANNSLEEIVKIAKSIN